MAAPGDVARRGYGCHVRIGQSGWLPHEIEVEAYDGICRADEDAFRRIAQPLQPVLRRLATLTTSSSDDARFLVAECWDRALHALDMFNWHTPLATWVAAGLVRGGRTRAAHTPGPSPPAGEPPPRVETPGPPDWSDLPWSARWEPLLPLLTLAFARLPLATREVLHVHDVERWPDQRGCDVLGCTSQRYEALLDAGHGQLRHVLAVAVGERADGEEFVREQMGRVGVALKVLHGPIERCAPPLDERTLAVFRSWARHRRRLLRRPWMMQPFPD